MYEGFPSEAIEEITELKKAFLELAHERKQWLDFIDDLEIKVRMLESKLATREVDDEWRKVVLDKKGD